ncbi:NADH dehydrogenase-like protein [compost metagenome]
MASIRNQPPKSFTFSNKGTVASLGKGEAIGIAFGKKYKGWKAAWLKKLIDLRYLFIIGGIPLVLRKGKFL